MFNWFKRAEPPQSFDRDAAQYESLSRHAAGTHTVAVDRIVGSVGRAGEAHPGTMLLHVSPTDLRYRQIRQAMKAGRIFPPVELYELKGWYYILDGHHRVAAARSLGQLDIDAVVTAFCPVSHGEAA